MHKPKMPTREQRSRLWDTIRVERKIEPFRKTALQNLLGAFAHNAESLLDGDQEIAEVSGDEIAKALAWALHKELLSDVDLIMQVVGELLDAYGIDRALILKSMRDVCPERQIDVILSWVGPDFFAPPA